MKKSRRSEKALFLSSICFAFFVSCGNGGSGGEDGDVDADVPPEGSDPDVEVDMEPETPDGDVAHEDLSEDEIEEDDGSDPVPVLTYGYDPRRGAHDPVDCSYGGSIYFIATDGSDDNDGLSEGAPWATFARANSVVQAGDCVFVRGGVYSEYVVIGVIGSTPPEEYRSRGTEEAPITWRSYPGEWAVIDGSSGTVDTATFRLFWVEWNIIKNFEIRNATRSGFAFFHSTDNVVDNLALHGHNGSGMGSSDSSRNRIIHCTSEDNFDEATDGENADGFAVSSGGENIFEFCVAFDNSDDGFDMWESVSNSISDCVAYANGRGTAGDGNGFKLGGRDTGGGNTVTRCIAFQNVHSGFSSNTGDNNLPCTLYNNTAYANETGFSLYTLPHVARNNLAYDNGGNGVQEVVDDLSNSWNDPPGIVLEASDFLSLDPAGIETLFLRLAPGSGAVDAGMDVGLPFSGEAPDLGAFEFESE